MPLQADTSYDGSMRPWQSHEENLVGSSLAAQQNMTAEQIRAIRPPLPRTQLFPPRFGYDRTVLGIRDVINVQSVFGNPRVDYSQSTSGYSGTSFPSLAQF